MKFRRSFKKKHFKFDKWQVFFFKCICIFKNTHTLKCCIEKTLNQLVFVLNRYYKSRMCLTKWFIFSSVMYNYINYTLYGLKVNHPRDINRWGFRYSALVAHCCAIYKTINGVVRGILFRRLPGWFFIRKVH